MMVGAHRHPWVVGTRGRCGSSGGQSLSLVVNRLSSLIVGSQRYGCHRREVSTRGHCVAVVGGRRHWWRVVAVNHHCQKHYIGMKQINGTIGGD